MRLNIVANISFAGRGGAALLFPGPMFSGCGVTPRPLSQDARAGPCTAGNTILLYCTGPVSLGGSCWGKSYGRV